MFSRLYLEISNLCNLSCSFCPGTRRQPGMLTEEQFRILVEKLKGQCDFLFLHVMGEPLLHPKLGEFLSIAGEEGFKVILTTNGTLLPQKQHILLSHPALYKVSMSLHSFEANDGDNLSTYLSGCIGFGKQAAAQKIVAEYRLWNLDGAYTVGMHEMNDAVHSILHAAYSGDWVKNTWGWRLADHTYIQYGERFDWPDESQPEGESEGFCRALSDQLAVLCDGTVVPCCLDKDGELALGNLFTQSLEEILSSPRASAMREGFRRHQKTEALCRKCGYSRRFA